MAEPDKIRKIAERLTEQMPSHFRKAETTRAERILREELEGLMVAAEEAAKINMPLHAQQRLANKVAEYGWPWRKS